MEKPIKDWGKGIPEYTETDLLEDMELHAFCTNIVARSMQDEGYTIEGVVLEQSPTQVIANRDGKRYAVIAAGGIAPDEGRIAFQLKKRFSDHCREHGIVPMFGSVSLMSHDAERAVHGLGLKYDGYRIRFQGPEDLSDLKEPVPGSDGYQAYCAEKILDAYLTSCFESLYDLFSEDIRWTSFWAMEPRAGKQVVVDYFDEKGKNIRNSNTERSGYIVVLTNDRKQIPNAVVNGKRANVTLISSPGRVCPLMRQVVSGEVSWVLIIPKYDKEHKICELSLTEPALYDFKPYYAFE